MAARLLQTPQICDCARLVMGHGSAWPRVLMTSAASVPIVIVGAGPTGLTLSTLLSHLGVQSLVLERAPTVTDHPQVPLTRFFSYQTNICPADSWP